MDIIASIKENNGNLIYDICRNKLVSESAPDSLFEEKLRGPLYDLNDTATRFILCHIEAQHTTKEIYTDLFYGVSNKKEEILAQEITNNTVYINKTLYLEQSTNLISSCLI